jgi:nondiscriminating glutamyl-tRNA synthetase
MPLTASAIETITQPKITIDKLLAREVRTRFAPSPTGFLHIGNLRTALYAYLTAKHYKGKFILRIEDTDQARLVKESAADIFNSLKWAGLEIDEYPVYDEKEKYIGDEGKFGPYIQSKRLDIYKKYAEKLVEENKAYYCFCTSERLEKMRAEQTEKKIPTHYDRACRDLSAEEIKKSLKDNVPHVARFRTPFEGETFFDDIIRGVVKFKNSLLDDYVLMKSDGYPTYHLASVVDDYLMEITHAIRGEEWLSSAPIHKLLYEAFGWQPPFFAHLPSILGADKKKLSKRTGDVAVSNYIEAGYLPEALVNFILLLGWNPGTEKEIFTREEMIESFSLSDVGKSGAIFDLKKLDWMNGWYIRNTELNKLTESSIPYLVKAGMIEEIPNDKIQMSKQFQNPNVKTKYKIVKTGEEVSFNWLKKVIALEQERMKKLSDINETTKYFFIDIPEYDAALLKWKKSTVEQTKLNLREIAKALERLDAESPSKNDFEAVLKPLTEKLGVGETLWPLRVALSGAKTSPSPFEIAEVLGKEKVLKRIEAAVGKIKKEGKP